MIISNLKHSERIEPLHPAFKKAFDYIKSHDLLHEACGRIELDGDRLFINNVAPACLPAEAQVLEVHRDYIDITSCSKAKNESDGRPWKDYMPKNRLMRLHPTVLCIPTNPLFM